MITVVLSLFILKEKLNRIKVISLALGVLGAMIILNPDGRLNLGVLAALAGGACYSLYIITTRATSQSNDPIKTLVFQNVFGSVLITPYLFIAGEPIALLDLVYCAVMGIFASIFHLCLIYACRFAPASILAPIGYLELVSTAIVGYFIFFEIPSVATIIGAIFIILAGIILTRIPRGMPR